MSGLFKLAVPLVVLALRANAQAFQCPAATPARVFPRDVTELHPGHVSVVIAMGDSITAAFASRNITARNELPLEFRQDSFSGGSGSDKYWTLPYFLRHYNPSLQGYSSRATMPQLPETGYTEPRVDFLNVALSSAVSQDLAAQVRQLQAQSSRVPLFNFRWKVLTILIGANDVCNGFRACSGKARDLQSLGDEFQANLEGAMSSLQGSMTMVYINLVSLFSVASVRKVTAHHSGILPLSCHLEARLMDECSCIDEAYEGGNITDEQLGRFDDGVRSINARIQLVADKFNHARNDFAVVAHTDWAGMDIPSFEYLSDLDCFHPSAFAHKVMAVSLWNSMFETNKMPRPINSTVPPFCATPTSTFHSGKPGWTGSQKDLTPPDDLLQKEGETLVV